MTRRSVFSSLFLLLQWNDNDLIPGFFYFPPPAQSVLLPDTHEQEVAVTSKFQSVHEPSHGDGKERLNLLVVAACLPQPDKSIRRSC